MRSAGANRPQPVAPSFGASRQLTPWPLNEDQAHLRRHIATGAALTVGACVIAPPRRPTIAFTRPGEMLGTLRFRACWAEQAGTPTIERQEVGGSWTATATAGRPGQFVLARWRTDEIGSFPVRAGGRHPGRPPMPRR
jgi:hypothetical protein